MKLKAFCLIAIILIGCGGGKKDPKPDDPGGTVIVGAPTPQLPGGRMIGHDLLGVQHPRFDYQAAARQIAPGSPLGFLDVTFGDSLAAPEHLIRAVNPAIVRPHLGNTVCVRNNNCGPYEPWGRRNVQQLSQAIEARDAAILGHIKHRANLWKQLAAKYPKTLFVVSPALEHNLTPAAYRVLADAVLEIWPNGQLVNNAMSGQGERYKGAWVEAHTNNPQPGEISSLDGTELMDIDINGWLGRTTGNKITFRWTRGYNCRNQGNFVDPRNRNECPSEAQISSYEHSTDVLPPPMTAGFPCNPIDTNTIWKPLAEDKGSGDGRRNKPVLIAQLGSGNVTLVAVNGQEVGKLAYYGMFTDGRRGRYYSGMGGGSNKTGYELQEAAVGVSGSPYVYARGGGKCIGPFVPGRRQGDYR